MKLLNPEYEEKWFELHASLSAMPKYSGKLAKVFVGYASESYSAHSQRILYVGKATGGEFAIEDGSAEYFNCYSSGFWTLARQLSKTADPLCGEDLPNLAWSNLCKIGTVSNNPDDALAELQRPLAVGTLKLEIETLKPALIVFVTDGFQDHFVYEIFGVQQNVNDGFSRTLSGDLEIWTRAGMGGFPPVLWMKHPQMKKRSYLDDANQLARQLMLGTLTPPSNPPPPAVGTPPSP